MATKRHSVEIVINAVDKAQATLSKVTGFLGGLGKAAAGLAVGAVAGVAALGAAIGKLAVDAAGVDKIRQSFDALTASIGETSEAMLADLRSATNGMVSDADLMQSANRLISMGLASSSEEAAKLSEMAVRLGAAMGGDATESMENFALTLANQSLPRLDSFGISAGAVRSRIEELMAATEGLSREQAFMQAVMEQGAVSLDRLGKAGTAGAAVSMAQLKATFENLKDELGTAFLPVLAAILTPLADLAVQYAPMLSAALEQLGTAFSVFIAMLQAGYSPLEALRASLLNMVPEEARGKVEAVLAVLQQVGVFVSGTVVPAISAAALWLGTNLPVAAQAAADFWNGTLLPALTAVGDFITTSVVPVISDLVTWVQTNLPVATQATSDLWSGTLLPALTAVWNFINANVIPLMTSLADLLSATLGVAVTALAGLWQNVLWPALQSVGSWIETTLGPILTRFTTWLGNVTGGVEGISAAFQTAIGWIQSLADKIRSLSLPDWMTPGSPTPWELGLRGVSDALRELSTVGLPAFSMGLGGWVLRRWRVRGWGAAGRWW